jgi:hypothetical protein
MPGHDDPNKPGQKYAITRFDMFRVETARVSLSRKAKCVVCEAGMQLQLRVLND